MANILGKYNLVKFIPKTIGNLNRPIFMEKKQLPKICLQYTTHTHTHTHSSSASTSSSLSSQVHSISQGNSIK